MKLYSCVIICFLIYGVWFFVIKIGSLFDTTSFIILNLLIHVVYKNFRTDNTDNMYLFYRHNWGTYLLHKGITWILQISTLTDEISYRSWRRFQRFTVQIIRDFATVEKNCTSKAACNKRVYTIVTGR